MSSPDIGPPPIDGRWQLVRLLPLGHWWWATFVASAVAFYTGTFIVGESALAENTYGTGLVLSAVGLLLIAVSGVLGALYVRRIGRNLSE